jgi:hypothetical protein
MVESTAEQVLIQRKNSVVVQSLRLVLTCLLLIVSGVFSWLVIGPYGGIFTDILPRLLLYSGLSTAGAFLIFGIWREIGLAQSFIGAILLIAVIFKAALYLQEISTYPFSLSWSEASWHYYASLFFSERIYGTPAPLSMFDPSRHLVLAAPFLFSDMPLWAHRAWQVFLWIAITFFVSFLIVQKSGFSEVFTRLCLLFAIFLYIIVLPIYYHLLVIPIIVLLGYNRQSLWQTLAVVLLASAWAGLSRINWFAAAGLLAATMYILETKLKGKTIFRYFTPPVVWTVSGGIFAMLSRQIFLSFFPMPYDYFQTSLQSSLVLRRLLPGVTNPVGILPGVFLASLPIFMLLGILMYRCWRQYEPTRLISIGGILAMFFTGGVIVSIKIGGGNNLHNLDLYFFFLLIVTVFIFRQWHKQDASFAKHQNAPFILIMLLAVGPVFATLLSGSRPIERDFQRAENVLHLIQRDVDRTVQAGGSVLFISERHLIPFSQIKDVPHVYDYEKITLMEMAISNNMPYLEVFWDSLKERRYEMIVSHRLFTLYVYDTKPFGFENDKWVKHVAEPILCYYKPYRTFMDLNLQVLVPRKDAVGGNCP